MKSALPDFFTEVRIAQMFACFDEMDATHDLTLDMDELCVVYDYVFYKVRWKEHPSYTHSYTTDSQWNSMEAYSLQPCGKGSAALGQFP